MPIMQVAEHCESLLQPVFRQQDLHGPVEIEVPATGADSAPALTRELSPGWASRWLTSCATALPAPSPVTSGRFGTSAALMPDSVVPGLVDHMKPAVALPDGKGLALDHADFELIGEQPLDAGALHPVEALQRAARLRRLEAHQWARPA
jgi:hypothetical protein